MHVLLHKVEVEKGKISAIRAGRSAVASLNVVKTSQETGKEESIMELLKTNASLEDIEVGDMLFVGNLNNDAQPRLLDNNWIKTSPISEIVDRQDKRVVFKTATSTYEVMEFKIEEQH